MEQLSLLVCVRFSVFTEQVEECLKTRMEGMENKEGWLNYVMLNGSSWSTEKPSSEEEEQSGMCSTASNTHGEEKQLIKNGMRMRR